MSYTPAAARDHIRSTFWQTWKDPQRGWAGIVDGDGRPISLAEQPDLEWEADEPEDEMPDITKPLVYFYVRHYGSTPSSVGGESRKLVTRRGFVLVRVYAPAEGGLKIADALSYVVKTAFERKRGVGAGHGIIFRGWRPVETGPQKNGTFLTVSTVDFEYDEITGV